MIGGFHPGGPFGGGAESFCFFAAIPQRPRTPPPSGLSGNAPPHSQGGPRGAGGTSRAPGFRGGGPPTQPWGPRGQCRTRSPRRQPKGARAPPPPERWNPAPGRGVGCRFPRAPPGALKPGPPRPTPRAPVSQGALGELGGPFRGGPKRFLAGTPEREGPQSTPHGHGAKKKKIITARAGDPPPSRPFRPTPAARSTRGEGGGGTRAPTLRFGQGKICLFEDLDSGCLQKKTKKGGPGDPKHSANQGGAGKKNNPAGGGAPVWRPPQRGVWEAPNNQPIAAGGWVWPPGPRVKFPRGAFTNHPASKKRDKKGGRRGPGFFHPRLFLRHEGAQGEHGMGDAGTHITAVFFRRFRAKHSPIAGVFCRVIAGGRPAPFVIGGGGTPPARPLDFWLIIRPAAVKNPPPPRGGAPGPPHNAPVLEAGGPIISCGGGVGGGGGQRAAGNKKAKFWDLFLARPR